jgi:hypothetical protein
LCTLQLVYPDRLFLGGLSGDDLFCRAQE